MNIKGITVENLPNLLTQNELFSSLSAQERALIVEQAHPRKFMAGEWLAHHGDVWPYLFMVTAGTIYGVKESVEGRSLIVLTLKPGDIFFGMAFFEDDSPLLLGLQAHQDCQIYLWHREQLMPLLWTNGRFSQELSRLMMHRMQQGSMFMEDLAFLPVRERLARLLLDRYGTAVDKFVARDLTLDEMASHIGTKREVVCRMLYRFEAEGVLELHRTEFMITDRKKLVDYTNMPTSA